jgi:hypothetical protein
VVYGQGACITSKSHRHRSEQQLAFRWSHAPTLSRRCRHRRSHGLTFASTSPQRSHVGSLTPPPRRPPRAPFLLPPPPMTHQRRSHRHHRCRQETFTSSRLPPTPPLQHPTCTCCCRWKPLLIGGRERECVKEESGLLMRREPQH